MCEITHILQDSTGVPFALNMEKIPLTLKFLHQRRWWRWRQISGMAFELLYLDLNSIVQQSAPNFPILQHCDALILSKVLFNTIHIG